MVIHFKINNRWVCENVKNLGHIYGRDMKNIGTNWVVLILIGGLIFLPSLYAWFNIKASWDPYSQTDQIPIGIVNQDEGANVRDESIHAGDEIVENLKKNDSMDWRFVDYKTAMDKVDYGDYFAVIVIPKDFSKKLATVTENQPEKAKVDYYVNEKINAIAPKITSKGASVIVNDVSGKFISTVNGVIFDVFNQIGLEIENDLPDIEKFENYVFEIEKKLPEIHDTLNSSLNDAGSAQDLMAKAQKEIPQVKETTKKGIEIIDESVTFLNKAEDRLNEMSPKIKKDLKTARDVSNDANNLLKEIQNAPIDFSKAENLADQLDSDINKGTEKIASIESTIQTLKKLVQQTEDSLPKQEENTENNEQDNQTTQEQNKALEAARAKLQEQKDTLAVAETRLGEIKGAMQELQTNTNEVRKFSKDKQKEITQSIDKLQGIAASTTTELDSFLADYTENIEPTVLSQIKKAKETIGEARSTLVKVQDTIPEAERILSSTESNLGEGKDVLESVLNEYPYVSDKITEMANRIRDVQEETDLHTIIDLLKNDPGAESSFFEEPVELSEHAIYPIPNYGSGMTPFYTTLAIWVGALLLISLVSVDVRHDRIYSVNEEYFGRLMTFITIGFLQSLIVTLGDIYLLDVYVKEPFWFVIFGLLISVVFMSIVYTLVSVFGDVGKAMAIVMLVLQIAGSGGTYPVVLLPPFFQKIHPFLPFTYGVDLMREAVGGIVWSRAIHSIWMLLLFGLIFIIIGVLLKKPMNKNQKILTEKSKESGLFH